MLPVGQIIVGDAGKVLRTFPAGSFNCSISSPPYWALRDYSACNCTIGELNPARTSAGPIRCTNAKKPDPNCPKCSGTGKDVEMQKNQLGLEPTFEEYIDKLCTVYDEVFRVLRKDGTCWVNLGDTYGTHAGTKNSKHAHNFRPANTAITEGIYQPRKPQSVPEKSLCLIPERFAIEMVNRGWILRNVIIWHKPNPMPSSAKDRFTVDFEQVFFFVKNNDILWYFRPDGEVSDKPPDYKNGVEGLDWQWGTRKGKRVKTSLWQGFKYWFEPQYEPVKENSLKRAEYGLHNTPEGQWAVNVQIDKMGERFVNPLGRNKRCVWTIPTQACPEAHFATFPEKLVEPMIKAGCPEFVCKKCGKAREKVYQKGELVPDEPQYKPRGKNKPEIGVKTAMTPAGSKQGHPNFHYEQTFKGYTDCGCNAGWRPGVCLDMFLRYWNGWQGGRTVAA